MKLFQICFFSLLVFGSANITLGQYGLYGSPDTINLPQNSSNGVATGTYAVPPSGYTSSTTGYPAQQPVQQYTSQPIQQQYTSQPIQQQYATPQTQPYATQNTPQYAIQPSQQYGVQQAQSLPVNPVTIYGQASPQTSPQYRTPAYSSPMYTAAINQQIPNQPVTGQPSIPVPSNMPMQQTAPAGQSPVLLEPMAAPPGIQPNSGVTNQMLAEQNQSNSGYESCSPNGGQCGVYQPYTNRFEQSACGNCFEGCTETSLWYGSISALAMSRDRPNKVYITYQTDYLPHNDYPSDELSWRWGGEVRLGRRFCSGCNPGYWALEASYWTLDDFQGYVSHTNPVDPFTVGTPLVVRYDEFYDVTLPTPAYRNATDWFDGAAEHRLWRRDEIHNVEANLVRGQWCYGQDSPWDLGFSLGVRYFRFQESWRFGSLMNGASWGDEGGASEAYLSDRITNDLVGPQIGFELGYNMWNNFRFFMAPKVGIYNNHMTNNFRAYLGNGQIARPTADSEMTQYSYPVNSSHDAISFLTQIDVGVDWRFARQWDVRVGYRVVAVSGIALADAQIPFYIVDIPAIADIDRNGDLILHGAFVTLGYNF